MSAFTRVAVWLTHPEVPCFKFEARHGARLEHELPGCTVPHCLNQTAFLRALPDAEAVLVWKFRQEWFARAPALRLVATPAAGTDYFSVTPPPHVQLSYGAFHGELMAETVLALMLGVSRGVIATALLQARKPWPRRLLAPQMHPLRGAHIAILGFGHIGTWIGRLVKPCGVRITGVKQTPAAWPPYFQLGDRIATVDRLDEVLPDTDHLVLCLPRTPQTDRLLDARRLSLLPPRAVVYNVGRGNAIDEAALAAALSAGALRGACLDVYEHEPLPADSALRRCPNVLLMPHAAAIAPNYMDLFVGEFVARYRGGDCRT